MYLFEAVLHALSSTQVKMNSLEVTKYIKDQNLYDFKDSLTPESTVSSVLGDFIRKKDSRVKRVRGARGLYDYYLSENEEKYDSIESAVEPVLEKKTGFHERDLHKLLATYLQSVKVGSKTIYHEQSYNTKDKNQIWIHPDMVGIKLINLQSQSAKGLSRIIQKHETFELSSYELKKEITSDAQLKEYYFQAVSNSSWANFGYLVAFHIDGDLKDEIERLNQLFGIGVIELNPNPFRSSIMFPSNYRKLDFRTIDKISVVNREFARFIELVTNILGEDRYLELHQKELTEYCDKYFLNEQEVISYLKEKNIPFEPETDFSVLD